MQIIMPVRHRTSEQGRPLWRQVAPKCPGTLQNRRTSETYPCLTECVVHTEWETSDKFWVEKLKRFFFNLIVINYLINYFKHVRESVYDEQIKYLIIPYDLTWIMDLTMYKCPVLTIYEGNLGDSKTPSEHETARPTLDRNNSKK